MDKKNILKYLHTTIDDNIEVVRIINPNSSVILSAMELIFPEFVITEKKFKIPPSSDIVYTMTIIKPVPIKIKYTTTEEQHNLYKSVGLSGSDILELDMKHFFNYWKEAYLEVMRRAKENRLRRTRYDNERTTVDEVLEK